MSFEEVKVPQKFHRHIIGKNGQTGELPCLSDTVVLSASKGDRNTGEEQIIWVYWGGGGGVEGERWSVFHHCISPLWQNWACVASERKQAKKKRLEAGEDRCCLKVELSSMTVFCNYRLYKRCTGSLPLFQLVQSRLTKRLIVENFRANMPIFSQTMKHSLDRDNCKYIFSKCTVCTVDNCKMFFNLLLARKNTFSTVFFSCKYSFFHFVFSSWPSEDRDWYIDHDSTRRHKQWRHPCWRKPRGCPTSQGCPARNGQENGESCSWLREVKGGGGWSDEDICPTKEQSMNRRISLSRAY